MECLGELVAYALRQEGTPVGEGFRQKGIAEATFQIYSHIGSTTRIAPASSGLAKPCARLASPAPFTIPAWIACCMRDANRRIGVPRDPAPKCFDPEGLSRKLPLPVGSMNWTFWSDFVHTCLTWAILKSGEVEASPLSACLTLQYVPTFRPTCGFHS